SRGNCALVSSSSTKILVDAGISCRETFKRMKSLGEDPQSLSAILITHEHCDHISGLATLSKKLRIPVFITGATYQTWQRAVRDDLRGCDVLIMESNHDLEMLRVGPYPWSVKQRVMSRVGHLSNVALADFFTSDYDNSATFVVLAHLSEQNNHPEIARREAER